MERKELIGEDILLGRFVSVAVSETEILENQAWARQRRPLTEAEVADALALLRRSGTEPPMEGDEVPPEYLEWRRRTFGDGEMELGKQSEAKGQ